MQSWRLILAVSRLEVPYRLDSFGRKYRWVVFIVLNHMSTPSVTWVSGIEISLVRENLSKIPKASRHVSVRDHPNCRELRRMTGAYIRSKYHVTTKWVIQVQENVASVRNTVCERRANGISNLKVFGLANRNCSDLAKTLSNTSWLRAKFRWLPNIHQILTWSYDVGSTHLSQWACFQWLFSKD